MIFQENESNVIIVIEWLLLRDELKNGAVLDMKMYSCLREER